MERMHKEKSSYREAARQFEISDHNLVAKCGNASISKKGQRGCALNVEDANKGRYGYRRITKELKKAHLVNHKTVQRLMRKMGIFCRVRMKKYNSFKGEVGRIAPNLPDKPNQK